MKRLLRLGLCLGVLAAALTCTALAAGVNTEGYTTANEGCTVTYDETEQKYTAAYAGTKTENQYVLLVVKQDDEGGYSISENTIMYIDQQEATAEGVSFTFIPRSTPDCVVLLGGEFSNGESPKTLGTLIGKGVEVSGSVDIGVNVTSNITLTLYNPDGTTAGSSSMNGDGNYSIPSIPEGTYYIKASKPGFIGGLVEVTVTGDGNVSAVTVPLYGGDLNTNGSINSVDLMALLDDFGAAKAEDMKNLYSDINENGMVNATDLMELLNNFGKEDGKLR